MISSQSSSHRSPLTSPVRPWHNAINSVQGLTFAMKHGLRDLVLAIKEKHSPEKDITSEECEEFYKRIFDDSWNTEDPCEPPDEGTAQPKLKDTAVPIGVLAKDLVAGVMKAARKVKADTHHVLKNTNSLQTKTERRAGAPVYIRPVLSALKDNISFQLVDGRSRIISAGWDYVKWREGFDPDRA